MEGLKMQIKELRGRIVEWLRNYITHSHKDGYVLGMSGGIDSTVLALLSKEATVPVDKKVLGLILPVSINGPDYYDSSIAEKVAKDFDIPYKVIDLGSVYASILTLIERNAPNVSYTNIKARLRSAILYFYANMMNYLVLGTVNKGEFYIGYFPKNSSAGDIMPLADLLKSDIRDIGRSYGLSEDLCNRKASGCVWGVTAEEEWGFNENELDRMVVGIDSHGEEGFLDNLPDICLDKKEYFLSKYKESKHKREFYPIFKK